MNKILQILTLAFLFTISIHHTEAQKCDLKVLRTEAMIKVNDFTFYLEKIAKKELNLDSRKSNLKLAVNLFKPLSTVEVSNASSGTKKRYDIKLYLERLLNLNYKAVVLTVETVFYPSIKDFKKVLIQGKEMYTATATFVQKFCGMKSTSSDQQFQECDYEDVTRKNIRIYVEILQERGQERCIIYLGDISVDETK
jgi:hypothetical protein